MPDRVPCFLCQNVEVQGLRLQGDLCPRCKPIAAAIDLLDEVQCPWPLVESIKAWAREPVVGPERAVRWRVRSKDSK